MYLLGDCHVVHGLALGLQPCRIRTALSLDSTRRLVDLNQRETVSVHIFEKGVPRLPPPPGRLDRCECKTDSVLRPFFEHRSHVFGQKADSGVLPNASCLHRPFGWNDERDAGQARGRSHNDPAAHTGHFRVYGHLETELVNENRRLCS